MKKSLIVLTAILVTLFANAQKDVTKFLGIPVDGTKSEMIQKLKAKGFRPVSGYDDTLEGEFNGLDMHINILTNGNKVRRIVVSDPLPCYFDESSIKTRFNILCNQFEKSHKYLSYTDYRIPYDENISYEISVNKKQYVACFIQIPTEALSILLKKYTPEDIAILTADEKIGEICRLAPECIESFKTASSNNLVWFSIFDYMGKYGIAIYYDNGHNQANGEDL